MCKECGATYTINPKRHEYPEETQKLAVKMFYSGVSGRGVGKVLGMSKANVYNWIKKTAKAEIWNWMNCTGLLNEKLAQKRAKMST
jgi:transposase-like protein